MTAETPLALQAVSLRREFRTGAGVVVACDDVSIDVRAGELLIVNGTSGAGKSTLLGMLGTLDSPTAGSVAIDGRDVAMLSEDEVSTVRRDRLGFVFQSFGLLPALSAAENVEVPLRLQRADPRARVDRVAEVLELVGLADHADQRPDELSGGQQQRVAIARAIVTSPGILIADEPTGQLDSTNAAIVIDLIRGLSHTLGIAAIVATHDPQFAASADHVIRLKDGRVVDRSNGGSHRA